MYYQWTTLVGLLQGSCEDIDAGSAVGKEANGGETKESASHPRGYNNQEEPPPSSEKHGSRDGAFHRYGMQHRIFWSPNNEDQINKEERKMKNVGMAMAVLAICSLMLFPSCARKYKKAEMASEKPVNCATAEADIRVLESEKAHTAERIQMGVTTIIPIGLVAGVVTGTAGTKARVATGEYNKMLDAKIAEIKSLCVMK
jgi:hypothetical protein